MDTMTAHGATSAKPHVWRFPFDPTLDQWRMIQNFLEAQESSLTPFYTVEEFLALITEGELTAWVYSEGRNHLGLLVFSQHEYSPEVRTVKVEFLTCKNFRKMAAMTFAFEEACREHGFQYVEAIAHPTIAEFMVKKHGYSAPGVHIMKPLEYTRRN